MKITGVEVTAFLAPAAGPKSHADLHAGAARSASCVVELSTDAGLIGVGIASEEVREPVHRIATALLLNEDPRGVSGLWERMLNVESRSGGGRARTDAIAVLDLALWDLKAKARGEPLWKTLGAARPRVNVHVGGPGIAASDETLREWYGTLARDFGFRGAILRVGGDPEADLRRLGLMRQALLPRSPQPALMIDAAECWSPKEAIRRVRQMEGQFDLTWVQEPARRWDFLGLKRVSNGIRAAVCAGAGLATRCDFLPHFHHRALDVVQVAHGSAGITGALQLADAAFGFELPVALAPSPGNVYAHLAAALPYCMSMEVVDPHAVQGVFTTDVAIEDGWAVVGDRPGHGLLIDRDALSKSSIGRASGVGRVA